MIYLHLVFKSGVVLTLKGMDMHAPVNLRIGIFLNGSMVTLLSIIPSWSVLIFITSHGYMAYTHKPLVNHLYLMFWVLSSMAVIVPRMVNGQVIAAR